MTSIIPPLMSGGGENSTEPTPALTDGQATMTMSLACQRTYEIVRELISVQRYNEGRCESKKESWGKLSFIFHT
jgi:hypothetical protein